MDPSEIKKKINRFRILIIGRANAGKTTILQRVCNTNENPEIFNSAGEKIDAAVLTASRERGEHDIENEMIFRNNPGFIFHDSRGFEAGSESEYDKMNKFIADRSKEGNMKDRIHTIWYCIPMDQPSRSFTEAEVNFFSRCDTGSIPVIVIFTKFDALYATEFTRLTENRISRKDAKQLAPKHAKETFANGPQLKFLYDPNRIRRPPKCHICLPNMNKDDADCGPLIERTAETLDNGVLQQLFISTQRTNLELCMKYAVKATLARRFETLDNLSSSDSEYEMGNLAAWFPHIWVHTPDYTHASGDRDLLRDNLGIDFSENEYLYGDQRIEMVSKILSVTSASASPFEQFFQLRPATVIIFEHSFYVLDQRRHLKDQQESVPSFHVALERYMSSPHAIAVRDAVKTAVDLHQESVGTAVHTNQANSSKWKAKLPFGRFRRKDRQPKDYSGLMETILKIALEHRLPRP